MKYNGDTKTMRKNFKLISTSILSLVVTFLQNYYNSKWTTCACEKGWTFSGETPWGENLRSDIDTWTIMILKCLLNMSWSLNMVHFYFTLSLRAIDCTVGYISLRYDLWMIFKAPLGFHGPCVKRPLGCLNRIQKLLWHNKNGFNVFIVWYMFIFSILNTLNFILKKKMFISKFAIHYIMWLRLL